MLKKRFVQTTITCALLTVLSVVIILPGSAAIVRDWYEEGVYVFGSAMREDFIYTSLTEDLTSKSEYIEDSNIKMIIDLNQLI